MNASNPNHTILIGETGIGKTKLLYDLSTILNTKVYSRTLFKGKTLLECQNELNRIKQSKDDIILLDEPTLCRNQKDRLKLLTLIYVTLRNKKVIISSHYIDELSLTLS